MLKDDNTVQDKASWMPLASEGLRLIIFAMIYWLAAQLGLFFVLRPEGIASIWPASGLALATLLWVEDKDRNRYVAAIFAANFLANIIGGNTVFTSLGFAAANAAEPVLGWWTFTRIAGQSKDFSSIKEAWGLAAAAVFANSLTAFLGAAVPALAFGAPYWATWKLWWVADGLGILTIAPFLLSWTAWKRNVLPSLTIHRLIEGAAILLLTVVINLNIFGMMPVEVQFANRPYALFPLIVWMAIRFESTGASAVMLCISSFFIANLVFTPEVYPWGETALLSRLIQTQGYLIMLSMVSLFSAASMSSLRNSEKLLRNEKEALRESEERYRDLVERTGCLINNVDGKGCITYINDIGEKIFGKRKDELIGLSAFRFIHPDDRAGTEEWFNGCVSSGLPQSSIENRQINSSTGEVFHLLWTSNFIYDEKGQIQGVNGIAQNITERKRAEEEKRSLEERLQRAEKMEALGTLAGGVAHDLNNLLGALVGNAEILVADMSRTDPLCELGLKIISSAERAAEQVQDLLTMARRGVVLKKPDSLNRIVADQLKTAEIREMLSSHPHVAIETEYDRDLLDINASAIHIERVVMNLITNALCAMPEKGTITIRTENRYLDRPLTGYEEVPKGEYAVLSVSDTGRGISQEHMKHLFDPFYMRKMLKQRGTGPGLSVIWGALKDHDGYIDVTSDPGKGATYTLYFPATHDNIPRSLTF